MGLKSYIKRKAQIKASGSFNPLTGEAKARIKVPLLKSRGVKKDFY